MDNHGRAINYLRLAVTDRCNLRCFYCMPEKGIQYMPRKDLLSFEEMERLLIVFTEMGISKLRITGGEPFLRKGIMEFLAKASRISKIEEINITTNGTFTSDKVDQLEKLGIKSINLSLDSLDNNRFFQITRRNEFYNVIKTLDQLLKSSIRVKINMVVMDGQNIEDLLPMVELTRENNVDVRFIEEMPFNGTAGQGNTRLWTADQILDHISPRYHLKRLVDPPNSTAIHYQPKGHVGKVGIIAAYSRTFCGSCNRIRLTPQGQLRTCLYSNQGINLRDLMRDGASDYEISAQLLHAVGKKAKDGFESEKLRSLKVSESMATVGG